MDFLRSRQHWQRKAPWNERYFQKVNIRPGIVNIKAMIPVGFFSGVRQWMLLTGASEILDFGF
jgi:hypothetical protein